MFNFLNILTSRAYKYIIISLLLAVGYLGIKTYKYKNELNLLKNSSKYKIEKYKTMYKNTLKEKEQFKEYFKNCEDGLSDLEKYYKTSNKVVKKYQAERRKYEKVNIGSLDELIDFAKRLQ